MGLIAAAVLRMLGGRGASESSPANVAYLFGTDQANANGYVSENGGVALQVWSGAANTSGSALRSNTIALMRARTPGLAFAPTRYVAKFRTPADVSGTCEFYVDIRDELTDRMSIALDAAIPRIYLYSTYTASELASTGLVIAASTLYEVDVRDDGSVINVYVNGILRLGPIASLEGAGNVRGGVTTNGKIVAIESLEVYA